MESVCRGNSTVGSNPTLSAILRRASDGTPSCFDFDARPSRFLSVGLVAGDAVGYELLRWRGRLLLLLRARPFPIPDFGLVYSFGVGVVDAFDDLRF